MGLISKTVSVGLSGGISTYYESLGYVIPRIRKNYKNMIPHDTKIEVKVEDLKPVSNVKLDVKCDCCGKELKLEYGKYLKNINHHNGIYVNFAKSNP